jgi:hypothetical protein
MCIYRLGNFLGVMTDCPPHISAAGTCGSRVSDLTATLCLTLSDLMVAEAVAVLLVQQSLKPINILLIQLTDL